MSILWPNGGTKEPAYPNTASSGFRASGEYGMRWHPVTGVWKLHEGIDLIGIADGVIRAPFAGTVTISAYSGGYGNLIEITAPNGDRVRLAHNSRLLVGRGARVAQGDRVAIWGTTGSSTGVHCHFEFIPAKRSAVNPRPVLNAANAGAPAGGGGSPVPPITKEMIDMATEVIVTEKDNNGKAIADNKRRAAFVNTESGFACDVSWLTLADADKWAKQFGMPAGALRMTDSGFDKFLGRLAAVK